MIFLSFSLSVLPNTFLSNRPLPTLLWRTLKPERGVTMAHCAGAYPQSDQGYSAGYINTTATLRRSHRDKAHVNFSQEFQCSYHRLPSEFIPCSLSSSVGGGGRWNLLSVALLVPVRFPALNETNLIWLFSSDKSPFSQQGHHDCSFFNGSHSVIHLAYNIPLKFIQWHLQILFDSQWYQTSKSRKCSHFISLN